MKNISKFLFTLVSLFLLFNLIACSNVYNNSEENDLVALSVSAEGENYRTILPVSSAFYDMAKYELQGKMKTTTGTSSSYSAVQTLKVWNSYESFAASPEIFCKKGIWSFDLYAYNSSGTKTFSGSVADFTVAETNSGTLKFNMKTSLSTGNVKVTLYFPSDTTVKAVKAGLSTTVGGSTSYTKNLSILSGAGDNAGKQFVIYNYENISPRTSYVIFKLYSDTDCANLIQSYTELVNIYAGETSTAVKEISRIKHTYKIYYNLAGGGFNSTTKIITTFSEYDNITLSNPTKTGYTFGGWYLTSDFTGDPITGWTSGSYNSDVTLYAKWN